MQLDRKKISNRICGRMAKAVRVYEMIPTGSRILAAISGGKDSLTMLYHLLLLKRSLPQEYSLHPVHVRADFPGCPKDDGMVELVAGWGSMLRIIDVPVMARLKPGKRMNCYWCATQRRMELLKYAEKEKLDTIALGHHMDDILETFFMNLLHKGELSTMLPAMQYEKYSQRLIRPLALVKEQDTIAFARASGIDSVACTCPYGQESKRNDVREIIEQLTGSNAHRKDAIFRAMANPIPEYLPIPPEGDSVP